MANIFQGLSKCFILFFNAVFVVAGIVQIFVGSSAVSGLRQSQDCTEFNLSYLSAIVSVVAGGVLFLIAFLNCICALQENDCMPCTDLNVVFIVGIATVIAFFEFYTKRGTAEYFATNKRRHFANKALQGSYVNDTGIQNAVDSMQTQLKCCGINGPKDWDNVLGKGLYPKSCCNDPEKDGCHRVDYTRSCREAIKDFLNCNQNNLLWASIISFGSYLVTGNILLSVIRKIPKYKHYA